MSAPTLAIALGLIAAVGYGLSDFLGAKASKHYSALTAVLCVSIIGVIGFGLWYATRFASLGPLNAPGIGYALVASILIAGGMASLYKAFEIGPVSLASPLGAVYPVITAIIGLAFFHAHLSGWQLLGVALVVGGVMVASGLVGAKVRRVISAGPAYALLASLMWGVGYPLLYQAIDAMGWQHVTMLQSIVMVIVLAAVVALSPDRPPQLWRALGPMLRNRAVLGAGLLQLGAALAINIGLSYEATAGTLVTAASSTYPAITMVLAIRHFKERVNWAPLLGAIVSIIGVVVLGLG